MRCCTQLDRLSYVGAVRLEGPKAHQALPCPWGLPGLLAWVAVVLSALAGRPGGHTTEVTAPIPRGGWGLGTRPRYPRGAGPAAEGSVHLEWLSSLAMQLIASAFLAWSVLQI